MLFNECNSKRACGVDCAAIGMEASVNIGVNNQMKWFDFGIAFAAFMAVPAAIISICNCKL